MDIKDNIESLVWNKFKQLPKWLKVFIAIIILLIAAIYFIPMNLYPKYNEWKANVEKIFHCPTPEDTIFFVQPDSILNDNINIEKDTIKRGNSIIVTPEIIPEIKIDTITGNCCCQMDSIWAWDKAVEDAKSKLNNYGKNVTSKIDYNQSYAKRRNPPDDGIFDAKVVMLVYFKDINHKK